MVVASKLPGVEYWDYNQSRYAQKCSAERVPCTWGLDSIDQRGAVSGNYSYHHDFNDDAYIIDTEILIVHNNFVGRATHGLRRAMVWLPMITMELITYPMLNIYIYIFSNVYLIL